MNNRPTLLFYCQHSLGMGHLVRAFHLTHALAERFSVVFLNGGQFPEGFTPPAHVGLINLPPLAMDDKSQLVSLDARYTLAQAKDQRRRILLDTLERFRPDVIVIELFPFGRKKFADEIVPLLQAASRTPLSRPLVFCSLRDILVASRHDQKRHDDRAADLVGRYFDGVLVHTDPRFARLEETFHPSRPLDVPVHYTGFVTAEANQRTALARNANTIVSAGGGMVGYELLKAAIGAQRLLWREHASPMQLVAGPFLPEAEWQALHRDADGCAGIEIIRSVPNLGAEFYQASASVSQCGYNTAMDILSSGVPALVVPFAAGREDEQMNRAERLARLGLLKVLPADQLSSTSLANAIRDLRSFRPAPLQLNLQGASTTSALIQSLLAIQRKTVVSNEPRNAMPERVA